MDARIKNSLGVHLTTQEVELIEGFLNRGFSPNGQLAIASIFLFAKDYQKSVAEILSECEREWIKNWQYQHPDIKGDADAPSAAGLQNRSSLENIYRALGVPSPMDKKKEIPKKAIMVATQNSVYRFGKADENGERTIFRDERPLDFSRCKYSLSCCWSRHGD